MVGKAAGKLAKDAGGVFDFPQQQRSGVSGDGSPIKLGDDLAVLEGLKGENCSGTLCSHEICRVWS